MPALHALISLYQEHFRPQCAEVARQQQQINALLASNDQAASALATSASEAASAATVAARNLELVRGMQEEAEVLAARLQRAALELEQLEVAQQQWRAAGTAEAAAAALPNAPG